MEGHVGAFHHFQAAFVRVRVSSDIDLGHERVPFVPLLDVQDRIVDNLGGRVDCDAGIDGKSASVADLLSGSRPSIGRVVEGVAG